MPPTFEDKCIIEKGSAFTLSVELKVKPPGGYGGFQSLVTWTGQPTKNQLNFLDSAIVWPQLFPPSAVTLPGLNQVGHSGLTGPFPPFPPSFHKGNLVDLLFECKPGPGPENIKFDLISIMDDPAGAALISPSGSPEPVPPASLKIACVPQPTPTPTVTPTPTPTVTPTPTKQPFKGDTDGDGCADVNENLPKDQSSNGGGRDYMNPWDYYDVNGDGVIDLPFDILGVIQHYAPTGAAPYAVAFDRGPSAGPNPWNMTAPDGIIDLANDILGVVRQYQPAGCV